MIKRRWFDPASAVMGMTAVASVAQGIGAISQGNFANAQAGAQAQMYRDQASEVQLDETRAHRDLTIQRDRSLSSAKATMAAQGGDIDQGIVSAEAAEFGNKDQRITDDSLLKQRALYYRANYAEAVGSNAEQQGLFAGIGKFLGAAGGGYSTYKGLSK